MEYSRNGNVFPQGFPLCGLSQHPYNEALSIKAVYHTRTGGLANAR